MKPTSPPRSAPVRDSTSDVSLVRRCLDGDDAAWAALVNKYRRLIYSIPVKQGFSPEDASDIFQSVCLELLKELPRLREPRALAGWLIKVTTHKCFHYRRREARYIAADPEHMPPRTESSGAPALDELFAELEQEQLLRDAVATLTERCKRLVSMLFFEFPPTPYEEVAETLGLARGSIGFIRRRCLDRLRRNLEDRGFGKGHG